MLPNPTDDQWKSLISRESIKETQRSAEKKFEKLTTDEIQYLRWRCKTDLFFLAYSILGYSRLSPDLHGHLCSWLTRTTNRQYRLILLPRAHFKTTVVTIADSIQCALPNSGATPNWPRGLETNVRILLAHESHDGATRFLYEITNHVSNNIKLAGLFPECVPSSRLQRLNKTELELPRTEHWAEPTFDTIGVGGHSQGRHFNIIKLDDLFGDKARDSKTERETTVQWFDNVPSFLIRLKLDHVDLVGTRYSLDDLYGHAMKTYGPKLLKYIRRVKEVDSAGNSFYVFHEEFDDDAVAQLKKNTKVWNAQYVNDPREGQAEFNPDWKRYYYWSGRHKVSALLGRTSISVDTGDMDRILFIDPATTGKTGMVLTGTDNQMRIFVLDCIKGNMRPPEFVELLFRMVQKWWPRAVVIEEVIFSAVYKPWIESEMKLRNVRFPIIMDKPRKAGREDNSKTARVKALSNYFSAGQIFFTDTQVELIDEFDNFGATEDYHMLDAMAYGPEHWRAGQAKKKLEELKQLEDELLDERDVQTGYSKIGLKR